MKSQEAENLAGFLGKATQNGREVITRIQSPEPFLILTATTAGETWQGTDERALAEVIVAAGRDNEDAVSVSLYAPVGADNYMDLEAKDSIKTGGLKFSDIHLKFSRVGQQIHLMYTFADGELADADNA